MDNNNPYDTSLEWTNFYSQPTENVRPHEAAYFISVNPFLPAREDQAYASGQTLI